MVHGQIVGVRDFVSKAGKALRQIYVVTVGREKEGLSGEEAIMIWADEPFKTCPKDVLLDNACELISVRGEWALVKVDGLNVD